MKKGKGRLPGGKAEFRETGASLKGFPDRIRAANDIAAENHEDPMQSGRAKRGKSARAGIQRAALRA